MKTDLLHSFLLDVRDLGSARIDRRKLAWMLGRANFNASAYSMLLDEWEEIGGVRNRLAGFQWGDVFTFFDNLNAEAVDRWV